ncbi:hypothetical protein BPY_09840 [Bifidobacterium psychraerophilum]
MAGDDIQGLGADRTGGSEKHEAPGTVAYWWEWVRGMRGIRYKRILNVVGSSHRRPPTVACVWHRLHITVHAIVGASSG